MRTTWDDASPYFEKNERPVMSDAPTTKAAPRLLAGERRPRATLRLASPAAPCPPAERLAGHLRPAQPAVRCTGLFGPARKDHQIPGARSSGFKGQSRAPGRYVARGRADRAAPATDEPPAAGVAGCWHAVRSRTRSSPVLARPRLGRRLPAVPVGGALSAVRRGMRRAGNHCANRDARRVAPGHASECHRASAERFRYPVPHSNSGRTTLWSASCSTIHWTPATSTFPARTSST